MVMRAWEVGKSEGRTVTVWIRVATSPGTKVSPRPTGLTLQESLWNRDEKEKQMTATVKPLIGASFKAAQWDAINWRPLEQQVQRLQMRIAKATREQRWGKVKALQWLLTHSFAGKLLSVRRVTQNTARSVFLVWAVELCRHYIYMRLSPWQKHWRTRMRMGSVPSGRQPMP